MDEAYFLLQDADGRVGLFTWDPSRSRGVHVPSDVPLRDFKRLGATSALSVRRLAACLHAARTAIAQGAVSPPQDVPPDVLVVLDPPIVLAMRDDVVPLPLERPAVLLAWGTAADAWVLARKASGWIDVHSAWADTDGASGLAVYQAVFPDGAAPAGVPLERAFRRLDDPADPPYTADDLPKALDGPLPSLPLRFIHAEVVDPGATLNTHDPAPREASRDFPWRKAGPALAVAALLLVLLLAALLLR